MDFKDKLIQTAIDLIVDEAVKFLVSQVSFLSWGPMTWITTKIVRKVVVVLFEQGRLAINDIAIDMALKKETTELKNAREKAIEAKLSGDENAIKDADEQIKDAARDLIRFGRTIV